MYGILSCETCMNELWKAFFSGVDRYYLSLMLRLLYGSTNFNGRRVLHMRVPFYSYLEVWKEGQFFFISFYPMVLTWTLTLSTAYQILVSAGRTNGVLIQLSFNPFRRESCQFLNWPPMCFKMRSNKHIEINAFHIKQKNPLCRKKIDLNFGSIICPTLPLFFALNLIILAKG